MEYRRRMFLALIPMLGAGACDADAPSSRKAEASLVARLGVPRGLRGRTPALAFSPDSKRLAAADAGGVIRLWDPETGAGIRSLPGHEGEVTALDFSADGRVLASGGADGTVRLWDPAAGGAIRIIQGHRAGVLDVAFSPSATRLATEGSEGTLRIWDPASGESLHDLNPTEVAAPALDGRFPSREQAPNPEPYPPATRTRRWLWFSPDSRTLRRVTSTRSGIWDVSTGRAIPGGGILPVFNGATAVSPNGRLWARAAYGPIELKASPDWHVAGVLAGHGGRMVDYLAFSPDGALLASAAGDATARLWDVARRDEIQRWTLPEGVRSVLTLSFSPDGTRLAGTGDDGSILLWRTSGNPD